VWYFPWVTSKDFIATMKKLCDLPPVGLLTDAGGVCVYLNKTQGIIN
jgi:hypothetical protein